MDSLVGYGSDDEGESGRYGYHPSGGGAGPRRREDDTNYDDVNMDMSEESQAESEPELPPAAPPRAPHAAPAPPARPRDSHDARSRSAERRAARRARERPRSRSRSPRVRDERGRRGLLGDRPAERDDARGSGPPGAARAHDARDAASPRFVERRDRERDGRPARPGHSARPDREDRRSSGSASSAGSAPRERPRGAAFPPPHAHHAPYAGGERGERGERSERGAGEYRPSSYKVNKKLEVMEKMGLQIKTPDGSMATARQLRACAAPAGAAFAPLALPPHRALDQAQKRKLLWANKAAGAAEAEAAKWSGARFAQDSDGKQVSKFMRLMGIKDAAAVKNEAAEATEDPNKKQEELFQAMQAQYEVARATTHTMRGVGLGFQRGNF